MKILKKISLGLLLLSLGATPLFSLTLKLGSLAPKGSAWDDALQEVAREWKRISNGTVTLRIYPGGIVGDEEVMLQKMNLNQLQAAAITGVGLNQLYEGILAMSVPLLIQNDEEFVYVLEKMTPFFEKKLQEKKMVPLFWTFAGWAHWFGKEPISTPETLAKQKIWVWAGNSEEVVMWKKAGFNPVPLESTELMISLQSGMVEAFSATPQIAGANQWFGMSSNMYDMNWAPMVAGLIISERAWRRIPEKYHQPFMDVVRKVAMSINQDTVKADNEALAIMQKNGLVIKKATPEERAAWEKLVKDNFDELIDKQMGREAYELIRKYVEEYRAKNGK